MANIKNNSVSSNVKKQKQKRLKQKGTKEDKNYNSARKQSTKTYKESIKKNK